MNELAPQFKSYSEVQTMLRDYTEIRNRLRKPPNAVPDTGIDLRRNKSAPAAPEKNGKSAAAIPLSVIREKHIIEYETSFCRKGATFKSVLQFTAREFGIDYQQITSHRRLRFIVLPRQVAFWLASKHLNQSMSSMGKFLKMDHTSVLHGKAKINNKINEDASFRERIFSMEERLLEDINRLAISAQHEFTMAGQSGEGSQVRKIYPVDNPGGTASPASEAGAHQDVEGAFHRPTTSIIEGS